VYHVLNRSVGRMHLFGKNADFEAFQRVMIEAHQRHPIRILSYCVMGSDRPPRPNQRQVESTGRTQNFTVRFAKMGRSSSRIRR